MSTALVPTETGVAKTPGLSLYELEQEYAALLDTEEFGLAEGVEGEFRQDLERSLKETVTKRDRTARFIFHCKSQDVALTKEIERLKARRQVYRNAKELARKFVRFVIESLGKDEKGKYRKLEGQLVTFSLPPTGKNKLNILDTLAIPNEYKRVTVTLPALIWSEMLRTYTEFGSEPHSSAGGINIHAEPNEKAIQDALEEGREVPGAELLMDQHSLRIK